MTTMMMMVIVGGGHGGGGDDDGEDNESDDDGGGVGDDDDDGGRGSVCVGDVDDGSEEGKLGTFVRQLQLVFRAVLYPTTQPCGLY